MHAVSQKLITFTTTLQLSCRRIEHFETTLIINMYLAWRERKCLDLSLSADLDRSFRGWGMDRREDLLRWDPADPRLWSVDESGGVI